MLKMSPQYLLCLQKGKNIWNILKQIKSFVSINDFYEFAKIVDSYNRQCESIYNKM